VIAKFLLFVAAFLLGVPGLFIAARGVSGLRRGFVIVKGGPVGGAKGRAIAVALVGYGIVMIAIAGTIVANALG
jgi:hypothetical protein